MEIKAPDKTMIEETSFVDSEFGFIDPDKPIDAENFSTSESDQQFEINPDEVLYSEEGVHECLICKNESLEGDKHPLTGVSFERKTITLDSGREIEGVFPVFDSDFDTKLPKELYEADNKEQTKYCNTQLLKDSKAMSNLTPEQREQVKDGALNGGAPDGYVWHHNEEQGCMQLVDRETHEKTGHTGGRSIWGGGY